MDLSGVIPALVSPQGPDGALSIQPLKELLAFLLPKGIGGLFVGGSTGEAFSLTTEERKLLVETVIGEVAGQVPVVVHVGSLNFREVMALSQHAGRIKADAVAALLPFYYNYSLDEVHDFYARIAEVSGLPIIIYALGSGAVSQYPPEAFVESILGIPGLFGIKFTDPDLNRLSILRLMAGERLRFYGGVDNLPLPMLCMGAIGLIGSNYSAIPELWVGLYRAFQAGDLSLAMRYQARITQTIRSFRHVIGPERIKHLLRLRGIDVGPAWLPKHGDNPEDLAICRKVWEELYHDPLFQRQSGALT